MDTRREPTALTMKPAVKLTGVNARSWSRTCSPLTPSPESDVEFEPHPVAPTETQSVESHSSYDDAPTTFVELGKWLEQQNKRFADILRV